MHFYYNSDVTDAYCIINNITQTCVKTFVMVTAGLSTVFQHQSVLSKNQNINVQINRHQGTHICCQIFHFTFYSDTRRYVTYCH